MKDRRRVAVYSLLALPFAVFGLFFLTLDPIAQANFFGDFKTQTAKQFGLVDEIPAVNSGGAGTSNGQARNETRTGPRSGGFDPIQFFAGRDADGDGKLTGDEIPQRMLGSLDRIDTDQDGSITLEELGKGWGDRRRGRGGRPRNPAELFSRADEDGDGKLTGDEIGGRIRENLSDIDTDQDGSITLEELESGLEKRRPGFRSERRPEGDGAADTTE